KIFIAELMRPDELQRRNSYTHPCAKIGNGKAEHAFMVEIIRTVKQEQHRNECGKPPLHAKYMILVLHIANKCEHKQAAKHQYVIEPYIGRSYLLRAIWRT